MVQSKQVDSSNGLRRVLVMMKLGDKNLRAHLAPMASTGIADEIHVVRDNPGPEIPTVTYHCPPTMVARNRILAFLWKQFLLTWLAFRLQPMLVMGFLLRPHGYAAYLASRLARHPVAVSLIAGRYELYDHGVRATKGPRMWLTMRRYLATHVLRGCDLVTCTGETTRRSLGEHGLDISRVFIIHHPSEWTEEVLDFEYRDIDVLFVGALRKQKHPETLVEVIAALAEEFPMIRGCVVGDGPQRMAVEGHAQALKVTDRIMFTGYQENVYRYYATSRVLLVCSEHEGFPLVFSDALAAGVPSVVTACGDIEDLAKDGYNCFVIPEYSDIPSFVSAVRRILRNRTLWRRLSNNALSTAQVLKPEVVSKEWRTALQKTAST